MPSKSGRSSNSRPSQPAEQGALLGLPELLGHRRRAMDVRSALKSQYHAALKTLHEVIEKCPDGMWNDPADSSAPFWRVAYHTLFYAHFYLQQTQEDFSPWARHREEAQYLIGQRHFSKWASSRDVSPYLIVPK